VTQTRYDADGNPVITISPTGMTEQRYDGLNRLVDTIQPDPQTGLPTGRGTVSAFDGAGNLLSVTDPDYNVTSYHYNIASQRTSQTVTIHNAAGNPVPATTNWTYDSAGNVATQVDADGRMIVYKYDALNRETAELWYPTVTANAIQELLLFDYDSSNRVKFEADLALGNANYTYRHFDYDNGGRLVEALTVTVGAPQVDFAYKYNADDFHTETDASIGPLIAAGSGSASDYTNIDPSDYANLFPSDSGSGSSDWSPGFTPDYTNVYTPDALERVSGVTQSGPGVAPKIVDFNYTNVGELSMIRRYPNGLNSYGLMTAYGYDDTGRATSITSFPFIYYFPNNPVASYSWHYESGSDRVQQFTSSADGTTAYTYDHQDQLATATLTPPGASPGEPNEAYAYDANGNRTNANGNSYAPTLDNEIQSDGTFTYTYDAVGNRTGRTRISSNPADDYQTIYSYDNRNRLVDVKFENNAGTPTKEVSYVYDAENELIQRTVTPYANGVAQAPMRQEFVYDQGNLALAFNGAGSLTNRYLWGRAPVASIRSWQMRSSRLRARRARPTGPWPTIKARSATSPIHRSASSTISPTTASAT
jgi:YD repeat-containing protein